jgi:fucose permease
MSLGSFGIGLSQSYMGLLFSACCYGAALGLTGVTQNSSIGILVSPTRVSQAMSGLHAMYGFSSFVAPLLVSKYLGVDFSWRTFFIGAGAFAAFVMIVALVAPYPAIAIRKDGEEKVDLSLRGLDARAYFLSFAVATYVIAEVLVGTRLSLYATREFGIPSASGSVYVMGFFLGLLSGRLYGMFFRIPGTLIQRIYASLFFSGVCIVFGLLLNPWGFVAVGAAMSMLYPAFIAYASAEYGLRISAVMGLVIAVQSILTVLMHQVVGWISDLLGIGFAMYLTFLFLGLSTYLFHRARTVTKASPNMSNNS